MAAGTIAFDPETLALRNGSSLRLDASGASTTGSISGGITVEGALNLSAAGNAFTIAATASGAGPADIAAPGALTLGSTTTLTVQRAISGAGSVVKNGAGVVVFAGSNSYAGATTVSSGTLQVDSASGLGSVAAGTSVAAGATLRYNATAGSVAFAAEGLTFADNAVLRGDSVSGGAAIVSGSIVAQGALSIVAQTNNFTIAAGAAPLAAPGVLTVGGPGTLAIQREISGAGSLVKTGTGTVVLSAFNSYTGLTTVSAGTLRAGIAGALGGTGAGTVVQSGAVLSLASGLAYGAESLELAAGTLQSEGGAASFAGSIVASGAASILSNAGVFTLSGSIDVGDGLTFSGSGDLVVSGVVGGGAAGYVAGLQEGKLAGAFNETSPLPDAYAHTSGPALAQSSASPPWANNTTYVYKGEIFFASATTYEFAEHFDDSVLILVDGVQVLRNTGLTASNSGVRAIAAGWHTVEIRLGNSTGGVGPIGTNSGGWSGWTTAKGLGLWVGAVAGAGELNASNYDPMLGNVGQFRFYREPSLVKSGTGMLTLTAANTYEAKTEVRSGSLVAAAADALGSTVAGTTVSSGASLVLSGGIDYAAAESLQLDGGGVGGQGALQSIGANRFAGSIDAGGTGGATTIASQSGLLVLDGPIHTRATLVFAGAGDVRVEGVVSSSSGGGSLPGLIEGRIAGAAIDLTTANPGGGVTLGAMRGLTNVVGPTGWGSNETWVYTGQIFDDDGWFEVAENIDDGAAVYIDGVLVLQNNQFNVPTTTGAASPFFGMGAAGDGWHSIEVRLFNGGGGAGAVAGNGWTATKGIGYRNTPPGSPPSTNGADYIPLIDSGSGAFLRTPPAAAPTIQKTGSGVLTLAAANTYEAHTEVRGGTLVALVDGALGGTTEGTTVYAGATLLLSGGVDYASAEDLNLFGAGVGGAGALQSVGSNRFAGAIQAEASAAPSVVIASQSGLLELAGPIHLDASLTFAGAGDVRVDGVISSAAGTASVAGLIEGRIAGTTMDVATPNPGGAVTLGADRGLVYAAPGPGSPWGVNETWVYSGWIYDADGRFEIGENIDDQVAVYIDGVLLNRNNVSGAPSTTGSNNFNLGMGPEGDGWHRIEVRMFNAAGAGGAIAGNGWTATKGIGYRDTPPGGAFTNSGVEFVPLIDSGDGSFLRSGATAAPSLEKTGSGVLTLAAANTYQGWTEIHEGTVVVLADGGLGDAVEGTTVYAGASLVLSGSVDYASAEDLALQGSGVGGQGALQSDGANHFAGAIRTEVSTAGSTSVASLSGLLTLSGPLHAASSVVFAGAGDVRLEGVLSSEPGVPEAPGLLEGRIGGVVIDLSTPNPGGAVTLGADRGLVYTLPSPGAAWGTNETWVYTGRIYDVDGWFEIGENIDDDAAVYIDGVLALFNGAYNVPTTTGATALDWGMGALGDGWHDIEIRLHNEFGAGGAQAGNGWTSTKGIGYRNTPVGGSPSTNGLDFIPLVDSGGGTFLRTVAAPIVVEKRGSGVLTFAHSNTYFGATEIYEGTVAALADGALGGTSSGTTVHAGASLVLAGGVDHAAVESLSLEGAGVGEAGALQSVGSNRFAGAIEVAGGSGVLVASSGGTLTLAGNLNVAAPLVFIGGGDVTVEGVISSSSSALPGLIEGKITGTPTIDLSTPNSGGGVTLGADRGLVYDPATPGPHWGVDETWVYTGAIYDADGWFEIGENIDDDAAVYIDGVSALVDDRASVPTTTGAHALNWGMGLAGDGWHSLEIRLRNGFGGAGAVAGGGWTPTKGIGYRNTPIGGSPSTSGFDFVPLVDAGDGAFLRTLLRSPSIEMAGSGVLTFTAANTYVAPTTVSSGTLRADNAAGSATGSGDVLVLSGATLAGTGSIDGNVIVEGSVDAGDAPGGTGRLTLAAAPGSTLTIAGEAAFDLGGSTAGAAVDGYDQLAAGAVSISGATLALAENFASSGFPGDVFVLIDQTGSDAVQGVFAGLAEGTIVVVGGYQYTITYQYDAEGDGADNDVALVASAGVEGFVWDDQDEDGRQDAGEPGVADVLVELFDAADVKVGEALTDAAGRYAFVGPYAAGGYYAKFTLPVDENGWSFTVAGVGDDLADSDVDPATGRTDLFTLNPGVLDLQIDAGALQAGSASGTVRLDLTGDGVSPDDPAWRDSFPSGVVDPGVTVSLYRDVDGDGLLGSGDLLVASQAIDAASQYHFSKVVPGACLVVQTVPAGFAATSPAGGVAGIVVSAGEAETVDFADQNLAPLFGTISAPSSVLENGVVVVSGAVADPSTGTVALTVQWDDPNDPSPTVFSGLVFGVPSSGPISVGGDALVWNGDGTFTVSHRYLDDGLAPGDGASSAVATIQLTATDSYGASSSASPTAVEIVNVAPTVSIDAGSSTLAVSENGVAVVAGVVTDPGTLDVFTLAVEWNDSNDGVAGATSFAGLRFVTAQTQTVDGNALVWNGDGTFTVSHRYLDDGAAPGDGDASDVYTVALTIADDDASGPSAAATAAVTVQNVAPTSLVVQAPSFLVRGGDATFKGSFADVGTLDGHQVRWNFGDGTGWTPWTAAAAGATLDSPAHVFAASGGYTVAMEVRDDDGGTASASTGVSVVAYGLAADPWVAGGTALFVGGTNSADRVDVTNALFGGVRVSLNFAVLGSYSGLSHIYIYGQGGNDFVQFGSTVSVDAVVDGGEGDDHIQTGAGDDVLLGGNGNDWLSGGSNPLADDRDVLIGGYGADYLAASSLPALLGLNNEDLLVADHSVYEDRLDRLAVIWGAWKQNLPAAVRKANVQASSSPLNYGSTVLNDSAVDVLVTSSSLDWAIWTSSGSNSDLKL